MTGPDDSRFTNSASESSGPSGGSTPSPSGGHRWVLIALGCIAAMIALAYLAH